MELTTNHFTINKASECNKSYKLNKNNIDVHVYDYSRKYTETADKIKIWGIIDVNQAINLSNWFSRKENLCIKQNQVRCSS